MKLRNSAFGHFDDEVPVDAGLDLPMDAQSAFSGFDTGDIAGFFEEGLDALRGSPFPDLAGIEDNTASYFFNVCFSLHNGD